MGIFFLSQWQKSQDLASEEIASHILIYDRQFNFWGYEVITEF